MRPVTSDGIEPLLLDLGFEKHDASFEGCWGEVTCPIASVHFSLHGEVAEWSKALRSGRSLFGGVGSNPTLTIFDAQRQCKLAEVGFDPTTCGL